MRDPKGHNPTEPYPAELRRQAADLYGKGETLQAIADNLGIGRTTVQRWIQSGKSLTHCPTCGAPSP